MKFWAELMSYFLFERNNGISLLLGVTIGFSMKKYFSINIVFSIQYLCIPYTIQDNKFSIKYLQWMQCCLFVLYPGRSPYLSLDSQRNPLLKKKKKVKNPRASSRGLYVFAKRCLFGLISSCISLQAWLRDFPIYTQRLHK